MSSSVKSPKVGIVMVHGAWHDPIHFEDIITKLQAQGHRVEAPKLASVTNVPITDALAKDTAIVKESIEKIIQDGTDVFLLMHSYGGCVGSEAAAEICEESSRFPGRGRIVRLFYVSAVIIEQGTSVADNPIYEPHVQAIDNGLIYALEPYYRYYAMCEPNVARKAIAALMPSSMEAFMTPVKYCGWRDYGIPVTYMIAEQDKAIDAKIDMEDRYVRRLRDGVKDLEVVRIDADHSPWLSQEEEFMRLLNAALENIS